MISRAAGALSLLVALAAPGCGGTTTTVTNTVTQAVTQTSAESTTPTSPSTPYQDCGALSAQSLPPLGSPDIQAAGVSCAEALTLLQRPKQPPNYRACAGLAQPTPPASETNGPLPPYHFFCSNDGAVIAIQNE
jgi:hypothetical protein